MLLDRQYETCPLTLKRPAKTPDNLSIFSPTVDETTGEHRAHFSPPIRLGTLQDDRPPINIFVLGTTSRGILLRTLNIHPDVFNITLICDIGMLPKDNVGEILKTLRRRHLVSDLLRLENILTDGVRILDTAMSLDEAGLTDNTTVHVRVRVCGGSTRLNAQRKLSRSMSICYILLTSTPFQIGVQEQGTITESGVARSATTIFGVIQTRLGAMKLSRVIRAKRLFIDHQSLECMYTRQSNRVRKRLLDH